ncbi:MAG: deoxyribodipyrimidine photo-lyase [Akkermansiaceae bacterium]|nr:deoxyribodipyrimidine photo-lyase [Akkermansiaceae bacterium]
MDAATAPVCLIWLRQDLRLSDHAPLAHAIKEGWAPVLVYLHAPEEEGAWAPGGASQWWLHHALADLSRQSRHHGLPLLLRRVRSTSLQTLTELVGETGAQAVLWHRRYEPAAIARDTLIKDSLRIQGVTAQSFAGFGLGEPANVRNLAGKPFQVFTPFWKNQLKSQVPLLSAIDWSALQAPRVTPRSEALDDWGLLPQQPWAGAMEKFWEPTRAGAEARLKQFAAGPASHYKTLRDRPDEDGTSRLSPWLHFGQISPREVWHALSDGNGQHPANLAEGVIRQLWWREFALHLLVHFPNTPVEPLRPEFAHFPWRRDDALLTAWQQGRTGYPIVDAGMRQLWSLGWMHNRVRMIAASFLVKHLLQPWQEGALWFWDTLVDADLANNTLGWQWTAGCGADAAPYFRVFNPVLQGRKFDPEGAYVRQWLPEIAALPTALIHEPWTATDLDWRAAGLQRGQSYPDPIVGLTEGRDRALSAYQELKNLTSS